MVTEKGTDGSPSSGAGVRTPSRTSSHPRMFPQHLCRRPHSALAKPVASHRTAHGSVLMCK